jgi:hypothetical protein
MIEQSFVAALAHAGGRGIVLLDLWDVDRFAPGGRCHPELRARLDAMNQGQAIGA